jgi:hypothetical protein
VPLLLDLTGLPEVKFIGAHCEVARWGRDSETPMFEFHVMAREVPLEILADAAGRIAGRYLRPRIKFLRYI